MRTTVTLDDDVAALLERIRARRSLGFKEVLNEALRRGLEQMSRGQPRPAAFRTRSVHLGRCLVGSIDDVAEVLAVAEDERLR